MFPKVTWIISTVVFTLIDPFNIDQKLQIFKGYFCKHICYQELSKITQSGHTVYHQLAQPGRCRNLALDYTAIITKSLKIIKSKNIIGDGIWHLNDI